jgi:hypothetical protein
VPQRRVKPLVIVEAFDVQEEGAPQFVDDDQDVVAYGFRLDGADGGLCNALILLCSVKRQFRSLEFCRSQRRSREAA